MELNDMVVLGSLCWGAVMTGLALHFRGRMIRAGLLLMMLTNMVKDIADGQVEVIKDGEDGIRIRRKKDE